MAKNKHKLTQKEKYRPPVVTVMGHIDHGKSTLLDSIRGTNLTAKEYGGITQHIGAYQVEITPRDSPKKKRKITFIDTPGHEAFSKMRSRGGQASDIVILVVAADDGVKPQTLEAIDHAKAAGVPIIVAINKIDLKTADVNKVKEELMAAGLVVEEWGGETVAVEVSAKTKQGLDELLEMILLVADIFELKSFEDKPLKAVIIESHLSAKRGIVVSVIVKEGTLNVGDVVYVDDISGKIKALTDYKGKSLKGALPGDPVEVLGLKGLPETGSILVATRGEGDRLKQPQTKESLKEPPEESVKLLNLILKADTRGTLQAIFAALTKLENEEVKIRFLHSGVGNISDSDVLLGVSSKAYVLGFNVQIPTETENLAKSSKVEVRRYKVIYDLIQDVEELIKGVRKKKEVRGKGKAEVLKLFSLPSGDVVVGVKVVQDKVKEGDNVAILREEEEVYRGKIKSLQVGKDKVKKVSEENECGILIKPQFDFLVGDVLEVV